VCIGPNVDQLDENTLGQIGARTAKLNLDAGDSPNNDNRNFDILLLDKVLSRKRDLPRYMEKIKELMRDDGLAIVIEVTSDYEIALVVDALVGVRLEAGDASRRLGSYLTHQQLIELFEATGYYLYSYQSDPSMMTTAYVIRKIPQTPREPVFVDVDDVKEFTWIEPLQKIIEERLNEPDYKTIWLTSTTVRNNGLLGMALCFV
jgi:hypothetical protein